MKILVTGGAGYIGSHVVKLLTQKNYEVVVFDNLSTGNKGAVKKAKLVVGDLKNEQDLQELFQNHRFSAVIHFAGSIVVPESVEKPEMYYQNNTVNSLRLINKCLEYKVHHLLFSSTAATYGIPDASLKTIDENCVKAPINPYGESKLMTENMLRDVAFAHKDFHYVALRYFNVCGADPELEIGQAFPGATHLIKVNCEAAAGKREKTYIYGTDFETPDGTGVRDYIHVSDLASAHVLALESLMEKKESNIYNCGYGHGYSVKEIVAAVKKVTGVNYPVEETARRAGDPASLIANSDKIKTQLKWAPKYDDLDFIIKTAFDWEKSETLKTWRKQE